MPGYFCYPFDRMEHLQGDYAVATYLVYGADYGNILDKAGAFAVGQSVGTWIQVPGITAEMVERSQARVLDVIPAGEVCGEQVFLLRLAFPCVNFGGSLAMLLTSLVGNDVSTALHTRLVDLSFTGSSGFAGPRQGMAQLRQLTGVTNRPLVLNMIKPCLGFCPNEGAKLFFEVAKGGMDLIKDDELLGSPNYNTVAARTKAYLKAADAASQYSGKTTVYLPNITASPSKMRENAKAVLDAGAKACLVNFVFAGLDTLAELCEEFGDRLFIMAHYAGVGVLGWKHGGIANSVFLGTLPRLAGAHAMMTMYPNHGDCAAMYDFFRTVQAQRLPMGDIPPLLTAVGGGITPRNQALVQNELGSDVVIGIGGGVQGHPQGACQGAKAVMAAVTATSNNIPLEEAACENEPLQISLSKWPD